MWVFLATEVMMFGGLFTTYAVYHMYYGHAFATGSNMMEISLGAINTAVLLTSSLTMALAVFASRVNSKMAIVFVIATMVFGALFLGIKFYEYYSHWEEGQVPGFNFRYSGPEAMHVELFFLFYFVMTGLHAVHMLVGMGLLTTLLVRLRIGTVGPGYDTPVDITGLYWHFVDIVWVFLFPLFYLVGRHMK